MPLTQANTATITERIKALDWSGISDSLWSHGYALTDSIIDKEQCAAIAQLFQNDSLFRKTTNMAHQNYGRGIYKYFQYPLPEAIAAMRELLYELVAPTANAFNEALGLAEQYPLNHAGLLERCHERGQFRPTPLLLHYEQGDFNRMHQDIYGELTFPLQIAVFLSEPGLDYSGGEFVMEEQSARAQSRVHVLKPRRGQMIIFATRHRPERGARGFRRLNVKHGVGTIESGSRDTLGIIFHDAK